MDNFIVSDWFKIRAKLKIQLFSIESIDFELMTLTDELKEKVELCETYEDMLSVAANHGLSYNRKRVTDDAELAKDIDILWGLASLDVDLDPCIKYRVGEKVCEISGLTSSLDEMLESEEAEKVQELKDQGHIDGDAAMPEVSIDQLNDDAAIAQIAVA